MHPIYLDYAADTPPDERVLSVYTETARAYFANPNSVHQCGMAAKEIVNRSLSQIADLLHIGSDEKRRQEQASLVKVNDSFKKIVIVGDDMPVLHNEQGITTMGLMDFLCDAHSLDF